MLIISLVYKILSSATSTRPDISLYYNRNLIVILLYSILIPVLNLNFNINNITLYNNLFNVHCVNITFNIFILILSVMILSLHSFYPLKKLNKDKDFFKKLYSITEYSVIILFIVIGAIFLLNSNDIISVFLSIELQSYGLYILCSLYRNSELSTSAGLTYFLLGSLSSCFILLGTSLFYTNSGITNLDYYFIINNLYNIKDNINYSSNYTNYYLLIMSVGFLFKISAAPFHFWSPDVYDAIPTITTTFVAIVTKISIFFFLFELVNYTNNNIVGINWTISLLFSSLLSLIIGTILGLNQSRIKRLFAYSTISHLGFILLSLSINSIESIQAFMFYIMQYSLTNLNAFILLLSFGYVLHNFTSNILENDRLQDRQNSPIQLISQIKGFFTINPLLSISFIITIYSLIGIPPLMGFFGKQIVLSSSLDKGYIFISLVAILTSVVSAVYYLNIVKCVFFEKSDYYPNRVIITLKRFVTPITSNYLDTKVKDTNINWDLYIKEKSNLNINITMLISVLTLIILLFIFNPDEWLNMINIITITIFN